MKKKIIGLLLAIAQLLALCVIPAYAAEEYAEFVADKTITTTNITNMNLSTHQILSKEGKGAFYLGGKNDSERYAYFLFDDKFSETKDPQPIKITIEYFDEGAGSFSFSYSGPNNKTIGAGFYSNADIVRMENTKQWKTAEIFVDDMQLGKQYSNNNWDCRLALWTIDMGASADAVYIHSIKFEKSFPRTPVVTSFTSAYSGNMFDVAEEKVLDFNMENVSKLKGNAKVSYYYEDESGKKFGEGEFTTELEPNSVTTKKIPLEIDDKYNRYFIYADVESTFEGEGTFEVNRRGAFSVFDKFDEKDTRSTEFFVNVHAGYYDNNIPQVDAMDWAGFAGARGIELNWANVEKEPGVYTPSEHAVKYFGLMRERGLKLIGTPGRNNSLYCADTPFYEAIIPRTEENSVAWGKYAAWVTEFLGDLLLELEVWNEPNCAPGGFNHYGVSDPRGNAEVFAKFQEVGYKTIKAEGVTTDVTGFSPAMADLPWIEKVMQYGGYDSMDRLSVHPYDWSGGFKLQKYIDDLKAIQDLMVKYGGARKPITMTELGFSSANESGSVKDERKQAIYGVLEYIVAKGEDLADRICYYNLMEKGFDPNNREHNFGMMENLYESDIPAAAKPLLLASAGVNRMLSTAVPAGSIKRDDNIWCYNFKRADGQNVLVAWAYNVSESVSFDLGTSSVDVYDLYTNKTATMKSDDGTYTLKLSHEPIYIVGNFTRFGEAESSFSTSASSVEAVPGDIFTVEYTDAKGRNLDLEVSDPRNVTVVENTGIVNGKGTLTLKLSENAKDKVYVRTTAKLNGEIEFMDTLLVTIAEPIEVTISTSQVTPNDTERWQADVTIKNKSYVNAVSGNVKLTAPIEALPYANAPVFNMLAPQESVTVHINLDPMTKKRVRTAKFDVELTSGYKVSIEEELNFTMAQYTNKKPTIDGTVDIGEWSGAWMTSDQKGDASANYGNNWTPENCSVNSNMMWDEENLYFAAIVTDDVFFQDNTDIAKLWSGDSIQIAFNDQIDSGDYFFIGSTVAEMSEFGIALIAGKPVVWRYVALYDKEIGVVENCEVQVKRHEGKTIYEAVIPWDEVYHDDYVPGNKQMRFSMLVNDHDSDLRKFVEYNSGIATGKNAMAFGKMTLSK